MLSKSDAQIVSARHSDFDLPHLGESVNEDDNLATIFIQTAMPSQSDRQIIRAWPADFDQPHLK